MPHIPSTAYCAGRCPKIVPSHGEISAPRNIWFLGLTWVHTSNSVSIGSAILAQLRVVTSRHTHRSQTIGNNKPSLAQPSNYYFVAVYLIRFQAYYCCCSDWRGGAAATADRINASLSDCFAGSHWCLHQRTETWQSFGLWLSRTLQSYRLWTD